MKRLAITILASVAVWAWGAGAPALAQTGEAIRSYDVTIEIRTDDSIRVTEVIEYDFGSTPHHGIFRDVPTREAYDDRYDRVFPLHVESVSATGGASADYEVSNEPGGITRIKIGDPDVTTSGVHTYTIVYTVDAAMNGFPDHDELYWNAIGDQWEVPVDHATATVEAPAEISDADVLRRPAGSDHGLRPAEDPKARRPGSHSGTSSRSRRSPWWWRSRRERWPSPIRSWSSRGASVARSRGRSPPSRSPACSSCS